MKLTEEQKRIIHSSGNIKINAVAGSGKTTTIIEYAKSRPKGARILYLAYNKSVRLQAKDKFDRQNMSNVSVETAHSLAFGHIVRKHGYTLKKNSYKTHEIAELLGLKGDGEKHAEHILANHIHKFVSYFCNSDKRKVQELNYLDIVTDTEAKAFVTKCYDYIEKQTRLFLSKMDSGAIGITHDFYLKKFQLSDPKLNYDYILFDEGQDASAAMLDIFLNQESTKVIVGDTHQQIYSWRHAVNSLEKVDYETFFLSTSFRFGQPIADLATAILDRKSYLKEQKPIAIKGQGDLSETKSKAVIARTNLGLLLQAINYITENRKIKRIYFEGNINSYTYAEEGASLYDVLNLHNRKHEFIKDRLIRSMKNVEELEDYIKKTEDAQLLTMVNVVKEYGDSIPRLIKDLKNKHVKDDEKHLAEVVFSTVHRSKGMEYDSVHLADDFVTREEIEEVKKDLDEASKAELIEEINLLYVAVTRAKSTLHIHGSLLPKEFVESPQIRIIQEEPDEELPKADAKKRKSMSGEPDRQKAYSVDKLREKHPNAYKPWSVDDDIELTDLYCQGVSVSEIADIFGRNRGSIVSRIAKLELEEKYGD